MNLISGGEAIVLVEPGLSDEERNRRVLAITAKYASETVIETDWCDCVKAAAEKAAATETRRIFGPFRGNALDYRCTAHGMAHTSALSISAESHRDRSSMCRTDFAVQFATAVAERLLPRVAAFPNCRHCGGTGHLRIGVAVPFARPCLPDTVTSVRSLIASAADFLGLSASLPSLITPDSVWHSRSHGARLADDNGPLWASPTVWALESARILGSHFDHDAVVCDVAYFEAE